MLNVVDDTVNPVEPFLRSDRMDRGHAHQADARVSQLSFHQSLDFLAKGLADPSSMMLEPTLLQDSTSGKTVENIRKLDAGVGPSATDGAIVHRFWR